MCGLLEEESTDEPWNVREHALHCGDHLLCNGLWPESERRCYSLVLGCFIAYEWSSVLGATLGGSEQPASHELEVAQRKMKTMTAKATSAFTTSDIVW